MTNILPGVFRGYFGRLDTRGRAVASIAIPPTPALAGLELHTAFLVIDPAARSSLAEMSNPVVVRIDP